MSHRRCQIAWGRTRSLEEPYALIGLVRICGGTSLDLRVKRPYAGFNESEFVSITQVGKQWICPEHGQISPRSSRGGEAQTPPASDSSLRIFFSYRHDAKEELVACTKKDIGKHGHELTMRQMPQAMRVRFRAD